MTHLLLTLTLKSGKKSESILKGSAWKMVSKPSPGQAGPLPPRAGPSPWRPPCLVLQLHCDHGYVEGSLPGVCRELPKSNSRQRRKRLLETWRLARGWQEAEKLAGARRTRGRLRCALRTPWPRPRGDPGGREAPASRNPRPGDEAFLP